MVWLLVLAGAMVCGRAEASMNIAEHGHARVTIILQDDATPAERYAAEELANTLHKVTGGQFSVVRTTTLTAPNNVIMVGPGRAAKHLFSGVPWDLLGSEQVVMRTKATRLLLAGGRPRGTLYAVYRFLQEQCGVRWWTPWASTIPHHPDFSVGALNRDEAPAFESRDPFWFSAFNGDWAARNFSNSRAANLDARHGGQIVYKGFVHTFYPLVPPAEHFAEHPEWYSLINGRRTTTNAQLCTTNPQLRDFIVEQIRKEIKASPDANIVSLSQNDCFGACQCDVCKAIDDREGSYSGTMLALVNYVAERIGKEFPNVAIDTLAYQYTRKPPRTIRPLPNVIVRLCSIECNFAAPMTDPSNSAFANDIRDWSRICKRLYIWDYTTNFSNYVLPHPNWFVLGPNLRFFHDHGARGVFEQGAYQSTGSEMEELRAWLLAQLLWAPYQDDSKLINEFLTGYYGAKAARPIRQYMDLMAHKAAGYYMGCNSPLGAPFLDLPTITTAEKLWQQAESAVKNDPDMLWRVRQGHLPVQYAFLARWSYLRRKAVQSGARWPLPASRRAAAAEWLQAAIGPGPAGWQPMTAINEGQTAPAAFVAELGPDQPDPVFAPFPARIAHPPLPSGIDDPALARGVDVQDNLAKLYQEGEYAEVRGDPAASDGLAVWMPGSHHEWATQFPLSALPARVQSGRWRVYAIVRVEAEAGELGGAFTAGVYDSGAHDDRSSLAVTAGQAGEGYKPYLLGTVDTNKDQYVWIAPAANRGVHSVWVDRVFFVPSR
jgi:hypothetical protein